MKRLMIISMLTFMVINVFSQDNFLNTLNQLSFLEREVKDKSFLQNIGTDITKLPYEGTPFLYEDWQNSTITLKNGESVDLYLMYFIYGKEIWGKEKPEDTPYIVNLAYKVDKFKIGDKEFKPLSYETNKKNEFGYMEMLTDNSFPLLKLYECTLKKPQNVSTYQEKQKEKFIIKGQYYYLVDENKAVALPTSKKEFFTIFGDKSKEMEKYFKQNKMKMKENDLIKLFNYYASNN